MHKVGGISTHRHGSLAVLDGEVVGGDKGTKTGGVDVLRDLEGAEGSASLGEVGGRGELTRLRVDQNDVSAESASRPDTRAGLDLPVGAGALGGTRSSVVSAVPSALVPAVVR